MQPGRTAIQGIGAGFIPETLDLEMVDRIESCGDEEAVEYAKRLAGEEGLLSGISCGARRRRRLPLGNEPQFAGKTIVAILPDAGERYLSSQLFDDLD